MKGERQAILIGWGEYNNLERLRCPVNDVKAIGQVLSDEAIGGFTKITTFAKGEPSNIIMTGLEITLTHDLGANDSVVIFYSGHGKLDKFGQLYLASKETDEKALDATSLAVSRILDYVQRSKCRSVLLILDCCYSGSVKEAISKGSVDDAINAAGHGKGIFIITSSTDRQTSHEKEGEKLSVYTKFLVEGLESGNADLDNDGVITATEAQKYAANSLSGTGLQTPRAFSMDVEGDFVLAQNPNYVPVEQPDPSDLSEDQFSKFFAVKTMIDMLATKQPPVFFIMFVPGRGYTIEGERYGATGLTVSPGHTPNIRQTQSGFACDSFFRPEMITDKGRAGREVINGLIKVRMEVDSEDIFLISGRLRRGEGAQIDLYPGGKHGESLVGGKEDD